MIVSRDYPNARSGFETERSNIRSEGVEVVRNACLTLNSTSPEVIRSIVVVVSLDDLPVGPSLAVDLAQRIAGEYGLAVDASLCGDRLVVRVHRHDPIVTVDSRRPTLGDAVRALVSVVHRVEPASRADFDRANRPEEAMR